jgi:3-methylcrotonyl-CoA carboxylase alpha subunit
VFDKILIANRGEIACRIMRTAQQLGIRTVAVFSAADRDALHVRLADEAMFIGPAEARQSYLSIERVLAAAQASGAQAVHPGYGFLSENADFAAACAAAGIAFIGPPVAAIRAMGSKNEAKVLMERAGVPLVPGYHGADQNEALLAREAERIGFPVLIKASAGGGGKGMRVVEKASDFATQLAGARREAKGAFADDRVLIEKYLTRPRHIEVQVFADSHGNCVHLFERDCSLQRRHQKVIEEAPAPGLSAERRDVMGKAAIAAANAVGYVGAGTVEFIVEDDHFYFMEMNTRLQVEHPVTEMITGLDLVEWQLRVAAGERLPRAQNDIVLNGHAFEARIYAEDPERDFLPQAGQLLHVSWPGAGRHLRIDAGVESDDVITTHYDPMIAKVIVWDRDRASALGRLTAALDGSAVFGPVNNLSFLARIARHPDFAAEAIDTGFIPRHLTELAPAATDADDTTLALATLVVLNDAHRPRKDGAAEPWSPWRVADGWQPNGTAHSELILRDGDSRVTIAVGWLRGGGFKLSIAGKTVEAQLLLRNGARLDAQLDDRRMTALAVRHGNQLWLQRPAGMHRFQVEDPLHGEVDDAAGGGHLTAPMPGVVVSVAAVEGQMVKRGAALMILEAMKMEHTIVSPADGRVAAIHFAVGDRVGEGQELIAIEEEIENDQ